MEAASILLRRTDLTSLRAASHITLVANEIPAFKGFALRYLQECQLQGEWLAASEVLKWHESLKVIEIKY